MQRADGSGFGVCRTEDHSADPGVDNEPGAHAAWFEGHRKRAVVEPPVTSCSRCAANGIVFSMTCRRPITLTPIRCFAQHGTSRCFVDHRTDWDFADRARLGCEANRSLHHGTIC